MRQALDDDYLPVWLQAAGYRTMHVGKFLNAMDPTDTRFRCAYAPADDTAVRSVACVLQTAVQS